MLGQKVTALDSAGVYVPGNGRISFICFDECDSGARSGR